MGIHKQHIAAAMATVSLATSCLSLQVFRLQREAIENLIRVSQTTAQTTCEAEYLEQDAAGSLLLQGMRGLSPQAGESEEFLVIDAACDQQITATKRKAAVAQEFKTRAGMYGRLVIPGVGIDVALIIPSAMSQAQAVTDAGDSACIMIGWHGPNTNVIADHNNQSFAPLSKVTVGMPAYIITENGQIDLRCSVVIDGHNAVTNITDLNYTPVEGIADYVCYTCQDNWRNVRIVGFNKQVNNPA